MERPRNRLTLILCLAAGLAAPCGARRDLRPDGVEDRESALLFNTASRFYRQKNWRDAANTFAEFLKKFPRHHDAAEARFAAGYCLNRVGDHAAAVELLRVAVKDENTPWCADSHFYLGRSLEAIAGDPKGDAEERSRRLAAAAESYGKAAVLYDKLARGEGPAPKDAPAAGGNPAEGGSPTTDAPEKNKDFRVLALGAQGEALYQAEKYLDSTQALETLLKEAAALGSSPYYQRGVYVLGLSRHALAKQAKSGFADSRAALLAASEPRFEKDALWEEAAYLLARLTHQDSDLTQAVEQYGRVVKKGGGRAPEAAYYRSLAFYEMQRPESLAQARDELNRFLKDYPRHALAPKARFYEALSAFDLKDHAGCEASFEKVAAESPDLAGRALLRRGQALLLKDEPNPVAAADALAKAVEALEKDAAAPGADPALPQRLAEALYWKGEALLAQNGKLLDAASAFGEVHKRFQPQSPELAEKALYQMARALYLGGQHAQGAEASDLYRKAYAADKGIFHAESLLLSAECAFHAPAGSIPEALRREAPRFYLEAAAALKDAVEARRAKYMAGVARYFLGEYRPAAEVLGAVYAEAEKDAAVRQALPELPFYLADSLAQEPRREVASAEDRDRWNRAIARYDEYLDRSTDGSHIPSALVNLGLCQEWLEDHAGATRTFERFLTAFPNHALASQVRFELGNTRLVMGDLEAAAVAYASAADDPGQGGGGILPARALYQKAMLERRLGKSAQAAETLTALISRHGEALKAGEQGVKLARDARYQRSVALLEAGKADEARGELAAFLEKDAGSPQETEARNQLARSLLDAGKAGDALAALEPLLKGGAAAPGRDQALYLAAWCHSALSAAPAAVDAAETAKGAETAAKHRDEMESTYRKLIAEHPQSPLALDAMLELGQNLFNRRAYAESKKWLGQVRETLESDTVPAQPEAGARARETLERSLFGLGFIAFEEGDFAGAAALLDRVLENPSSPLAPRAAFQSGRALMKSSDAAGAAARFQKVADELKDRAGDLHEESLLRLGECYHQIQKYAEAIKVLDRELKEYPEGALRHEARFARGFALQFSGDLDGAVEAYRAVVAGTRQPVAARAQYHIGECRVEQGRHRDAAKELNTCVANFDFDGEYREWVRRSLLAAGMAFQAAGDPAAAATQLRELVERFPDTDESKAAAERLRGLEVK